MTEKQEQAEAPQPAPSHDAGSPPHADAKPRSGPGGTAPAPLGEWRGPAFWMACGALLAAMAGGAFVLAQRVSVERDMMAVAATLPAAAHVRQAPPPVGAEVAPQQAAAAVKTQQSAPPLTVQAGRHRADRLGRGEERLAHALPRGAAAKKHRKLSAGAIGKWKAAEEKYAEVFKRCPSPGEAGAIRCRHDICNGAEGKGPACRPYVGKLAR